MKCECKEWNENIAKINDPIVLQSIRSGFKYQYDGKKFKFCPWCGHLLMEEVVRSFPIKQSKDFI